MILPITRPLIALDVETHDKCEPEKARIVELGFKIVYPDGRESKRWVSYVRPDMLISEGATAVHGITNDVVFGCQTCGKSQEDHENVPSPVSLLTVNDGPPIEVKGLGVDHSFDPWPTFKELSANIAQGFTNCDYAGYHVRFDIRVIASEMERAGVQWSQGDARLLDSMHLWRIGQPRTLTDAVREFLGRGATKAHRALEDAEDALDVALAQLERWPQLPRDLGKLHDLCFNSNNVDPDGKFTYDVDGEAVCSFGKWKNTKLRLIPKDYLKWMVEKGDFSSDVKRISREALNGVYPTKTSGAVGLEEAPF